MGLQFSVEASATPTAPERRAEILAAPGFGRIFTDHMVTVRWTSARGWHDALVRPYGPLQLDPATQVFHYGQSIFEGFKAYQQPDGSIATFRPAANGERFNRSAARLALPSLPVEDFVAAADLLVKQDAAWVPSAPGTSLYLRPFMMATEVGLGVRPADDVMFLVIASPAASYFTGGNRPVTIWLSEEYTRAAPGGTGAAKCAGNYAASLLAQQEAIDNGCDQVVFLDAVERRWVEELGGMNIWFVLDDGSLLTPELTGSNQAGEQASGTIPEQQLAPRPFREERRTRGTRRQLPRTVGRAGRTSRRRPSTGARRADAASRRTSARTCGSAQAVAINRSPFTDCRSPMNGSSCPTVDGKR